MGTRAMITINGKPFVATHYDGYPDDLGESLSKVRDISGIVRVARQHSIDFADLKNSEIQKLREERFQKISEKTKGKYSVEDLKRLDKQGRQITFDITSYTDLPIGSIKGYDDFAEYEYDFNTKTGKWMMRKRSGWYHEKKTGAWKKLDIVVSEGKKKLAKVV